MMFVITQLIGLYVVNYYLSSSVDLPYGFGQKMMVEEKNYSSGGFLLSFITSFIIAVAIIFLLMRIKSVWIMRVWFFVVISLALGITLNIFTTKLSLGSPSLIALFLGVLLAFFKIFKRNFIVHNLTELLIYPGIAAIFVTMINLWFMIVLLILISIYDIWAVWHSGIMQKMAKYQMNEVGIFGGFFIPYASRKVKDKINMLKMKYQSSKIPINVLKKHNIKVNLAILGGGDIIFPIISSGVFYKTFHSLAGALTVVIFASLALLYLFVFAKKRKYYPAMPYLTTGIFLGMLIGWLLFVR
jgi:presenilin-like A22 family membrane protease